MDRRSLDAWMSAIAQYQSSKLEKVASPAQDEQAIAQAELNQYIAIQAEVVVPEELTVREIHLFECEVFHAAELIAIITYDHDLTQPWVVIVKDKEKFRANTWARCYRYIQWHHKQRTLDAPLPMPVPPVQQQLEPEEPRTTGNEIMSQIFNACEQHSLELLDDGIYRNDEKLGEVGFTDGNWWVIRASSEGQKMACNSADEAVRLLLVVEAVDWDELLEKPFEQLSRQEWLLVMEFESVRELVTA
ncbi:hypothetical protein A6770_39705 [Nostoc minutum NIES-26]|uniref:Uncharacterized protein n=1 Tax=Nostoc minutum NIES-26 TaxID=1844469 RepID=A0A367RSG7_9NOSO|nr:hypothetical protein A6770_39705 [Nostoc minutum NIES-26]